jgi:hypothetical protein
MNLEECPVKSISLFMRMRDLEKLGEVGVRNVYREGFGQGSEFVHNGTKVQFLIGVTGSPSERWHGMPEGLIFDVPHDVAVNPATGQVLAYAMTL